MDNVREITRRHFFGHLFGQAAGFGLGAAALSALLNEEGFGQAGAPGLHHAPRVKRVIYLQMAGAPSQLDLFEYKPLLMQRDGEPVPESLIKGDRFAFIRGIPKLLRPMYTFRQYGQSGAWVSNLLPGLASVVDEVAFIRSMYSTQINHGPAQIFLTTGHQIIGRPSFGSWLSYGIGSEAKDLPAFVVLLSGSSQPDGGSACWGSGFLPSVHQGVPFRKAGEPVLFVSNPSGMSSETRRRSLDALNDLNSARLEKVGDPEISTRIAAAEMAYKMQSSVPALTDISSEPASVHEMYGTTPGKASFANNCLLARRLAERGVRFIQLFHRGWDHHGISSNTDLVTGLPPQCRQTDRPTTALLKDLKQRGLLDDTLVIWAGEFGRTPMAQEQSFVGRDHHPKAFTIWTAGGGIKPGTSVGQSDEFGYDIAENPVSVHDLHATALHLLGIDHTKLTYKFQGRNFRLTDVEGRVVTELLA